MYSSLSRTLPASGRSSAISAIAVLALSSAAPAQSVQGYYNVESQQVRPITVATVGGHDFLLVCNTPASTVEIYDTNNNSFRTAIPTGAEPVSVTWSPALQRLYTANFLGDSVTSASLTFNSLTNVLTATLLRTDFVGDEPNHVAVRPGETQLWVTLGSMSAVAVVDPTTLLPIAPGFNRIDLLDAAGTKAVKEPRTVLFQGTNAFILNHRGGKVTDALPTTYDLDVWRQDTTTNAITTFGGMGTTNFNMVLASNGDLYVVGTDAQFDQAVDEPGVANMLGGFAQTFLYRLLPDGTIQRRDLNKDTVGVEVAKALSVAHVSDILLFETGGVVSKVYLAAFNSDRVAVALVPAGAGDTWSISTRIPITPVRNDITNTMAGPRGLALKTAKVGVVGDPGNRVYVMNRLDNSVSVINPTNDTLVTTFLLQREPTPAVIRNGRKFLYDARLSQNGFGACASCHTDGRSDWLQWKLSHDLGGLPTTTFTSLKDGILPAPPPSEVFPVDKGGLVTQTLQGMLNYPVEAASQSSFTNEPLHWRADKPKFEDFNGAFVDLLKGSLLTTGPNSQMAAFRAFVMTIAYPPNPEEALDRRPRGTLGSLTDDTSGTGALRGMKLFHMRGLPHAGGDVLGGRSCVGCHALPEGSENLVSMRTLSERSVVGSGTLLEPMETAALRLLRQKEAVLEKGSSATPATIRTALFGLEHQGSPAVSINSFISAANSFRIDLPGDTNFPPLWTTEDLLSSLIQLNREWDTGTGPSVGRPVFVDAANKALSATTVSLNFAETQAGLANHGLVAQAVIGGARRGFWWDLTGTVPMYQEEPTGTLRNRAQLLALIGPNDRMVFQAVALGSERKMAWPSNTGNPANLIGTPTGLSLESMVTDSFWQDVPGMRNTWQPAPPPGVTPFTWLGGSVPTPPFLQKIRILQQGILTDGAGLNLGLPHLRHDAPRRLRVAGNSIRHGAFMTLTVPGLGSLRLDLHPTNTTNAAGRRIWVTHAELEPLLYCQLLLGGPTAPGVAAVMNGTFTNETPPANTFAPATANSYTLRVDNPGSGFGIVLAQRLRLGTP